MSFSVAEVWAGPAVIAAIIAFVAGYVAAAVLAARRFGARGLWGVWAAATLLAAIAMGGGPRDPTPFAVQFAALALPTGVCALVIARTLRRPGVRKRVQLLLGGAAFVLALPLTALVLIALMVAMHPVGG